MFIGCMLLRKKLREQFIKYISSTFSYLIKSLNNQNVMGHKFSSNIDGAE